MAGLSLLSTPRRNATADFLKSGEKFASPPWWFSISYGVERKGKRTCSPWGMAEILNNREDTGWYFFFFILIAIWFTYHRLHPLKLCNSVVFRVFRVVPSSLWLSYVPKHFHHPKKILQAHLLSVWIPNNEWTAFCPYCFSFTGLFI